MMSNSEMFGRFNLHLHRYLFETYSFVSDVARGSKIFNTVVLPSRDVYKKRPAFRSLVRGLFEGELIRGEGDYQKCLYFTWGLIRNRVFFACYDYFRVCNIH